MPSQTQPGHTYVLSNNESHDLWTSMSCGNKGQRMQLCFRSVVKRTRTKGGCETSTLKSLALSDSFPAKDPRWLQTVPLIQQAGSPVLTNCCCRMLSARLLPCPTRTADTQCHATQTAFVPYSAAAASWACQTGQHWLAGKTQFSPVDP
jgi:hypothetical protein